MFNTDVAAPLTQSSQYPLLPRLDFKMRLYPRYANIPKVWNKDNLQRKLLESVLKSEDPFRNLIKGNESDFLEEGSIFLTFAGVTNGRTVS